jgi:uncharacterized protein (DUF983 family)
MAFDVVMTGMRRGFAGHCPQCGKGPLLHRYLKVVSPCRVCGHDNAQYPSDDAPPYFTILIVGHLVIAPLLLLPVWRWPIGWVLGVTLPGVAALTLLLLPRVKGAIIGLMWAMGHTNADLALEDGAVGWSDGGRRAGQRG